MKLTSQDYTKEELTLIEVAVNTVKNWFKNKNSCDILEQFKEIDKLAKSSTNDNNFRLYQLKNGNKLSVSMRKKCEGESGEYVNIFAEVTIRVYDKNNNYLRNKCIQLVKLVEKNINHEKRKSEKLEFESCLYNTSFNGLSINKYRKNKKIVLLVQDKNYNNVKNYKKLEFETEEAYEKWINRFDESPYSTTADLNEKLEIMREA